MNNASALYKILSKAGQSLIFFIEKWMALFAREKGAVISPAQFAWVSSIEAQQASILSELNRILCSSQEIPNFGDLSKEQKRIMGGAKNWRTFVLYAYGMPVEQNICQCPATAAIVREIPGMSSALFSVIGPHSSILPHRGPYKGVLRYHLALIVPEPADSCGIRIDGKVYHWKRGESLIFDDTFEHEVWNNSDERRVVLFVDFKRSFRFPFGLINNAMVWLIGHSPFITNLLDNIEKGR